MRFGVIGINFKSACLDERESLTHALTRLFGRHSRYKGVLLATCNRTELYFHDEDPARLHSQFIKELRMSMKGEFDHALYTFFDQECLAHLSKVTAGLDSAFLGESEIQHQVKCTYMKASNDLPSDLHYLFQKSLHNGKVIRTQLCLDRLAPTLPSVVSRHAISYDPKRILIVGRSDIGHKCALSLRRRMRVEITLCTRYPNGERTLPWDQLALWPSYDIVIATSKTDEPLLLNTHHYDGAPVKAVFDLGVPRNAQVLPIPCLDIDQLAASVKQLRLSQVENMALGEKKIREIVARQFKMANRNRRSA